MDQFLQIFFILWLWILPIVAIILIPLIPILWFLIMPGIARNITMNRWRKCSYHMIADDSGYAWLIATKEEIAEGIVRTKKGWRLLPRPVWLIVKRSLELIKGDKKSKVKEEQKDRVRERVERQDLTDAEREVEAKMLRKFTWAQLGKPIWFGYAGKVGSCNPATLAGLQQTEGLKVDVAGFIKKMKESVKALAKDERDKLMKMVNELEKSLSFKEITFVDPTIIKKLFPKMYTPSQLEAYGQNRFNKGRKSAGKQYQSLILGGAIIIGLVVLGIVAMITLGKG